MSSSPETIEKSSQYIPSQGEQPNINSAYQQMYSLFNNPQEMYPNQTFIGASPYSEQAVEGYGGLVNPFNDQATAMSDTWSRGLSASDVANNPYVQGQLDTNAQQVNQNLQRNILPSIQQGAIQAGGMNNARQGIAEGVAAGDASTALANANATTMFNAYESGLAHERGMLQEGQGLRDAYTSPWEAASTAGNAVEGYQNMALQDAMTRWGFPQEQANESLNNLIAQLGGMKYGMTFGEETNPNYEDSLTSAVKIAASLGSSYLTGGVSGGGTA